MPVLPNPRGTLGTAFIVLLTAGLLGACTAKPTGYSDFDIETDFSTFRTFTFVPGNTLVVGAIGEASAATGINGNELDDTDPDAGAVYVFTRDGFT